MSWNIPETWQMATLADVCYRIVDGSHNPPSGQASGKPMLSAKNIQNGKIHFDELRLLSDDDFEVENKRTSISAGDVLVTIVGALGRTAVVPEVHNEFTLQRSVAVLKPETINSNYLHYLLDSPVAQIFFLENAKGTAQKGIYLKALGAMPAPIAPLAEQTRIAQKLDELLAKVDTLKARIDGIPALLKRFRQSVLAAAVSGRLTEEWRSSHPDRPVLSIEDLELGIKSSDFKPKAKEIGPAQVSAIPGWLNAPLGAVLSVKSGDGLTAKEMNDDGNIPVYGGNGVNGHHTENNVTTRTVVIGRVGYYCGSVHFTPSKAWITDNALIVSHPKTLFDINYIYWLLLGTNLRENTSSSAQPVISGEKIYPIILSIPPLTEQTEIVRRIEQLLAFADQLESKVQNAKSRIDHLTQSTLAKAFRGELVPQDPNEEPASVLLERIKAQRAAAPKAKRGRKVSA